MTAIGREERTTVDFDFITDEQFRSSLLSDYHELQLSLRNNSWKAAHVLAGSIVEAILIEYLIVSELVPSGEDPLKMTLDRAISLCKTHGVILDTTASLCDVIRQYRNLIHPGRLIRLEQEATQEGASIARSLVAVIAKDVATKRKATYGMTAEQVVKKLSSDKHALAVLPHILSETKDHELKRLVNTAIPEAYNAELREFQPDTSVLSRYSSAYSETLTSLTANEQIKVAKYFAKLVREESNEEINAFADAFFSAEQIAHLRQNDADMVTSYLLTILEAPELELTDGVVRMMAGIANFVPENQTSKLADSLIKIVRRQADDEVDRALTFVGRVFDNANEDRQQIMERRIEIWIEYGNSRPLSATAQHRLTQIQNQWLNIPF